MNNSTIERELEERGMRNVLFFQDASEKDEGIT